MRRLGTWPLLLGLLVLGSLVAMGVWISVRHGEGHFLYSLDDAYIHMAVARNFVVHGVWGVTRHGFSSSTSSLLWPFLLAGVSAIVGEHTISPLVLNIVFAVATLVLVYAMLRTSRLRPAAIAAIIESDRFAAVCRVDESAHLICRVVEIPSAADLAESLPPAHRHWSGQKAHEACDRHAFERRLHLAWPLYAGAQMLDVERGC